MNIQEFIRSLHEDCVEINQRKKLYSDLCKNYNEELVKVICVWLSQCDIVECFQQEKRDNRITCISGEIYSEKAAEYGEISFKLFVTLDSVDFMYDLTEDLPESRNARVAIVTTLGEAIDVVLGMKSYNFDEQKLERIV